VAGALLISCLFSCGKKGPLKKLPDAVRPMPASVPASPVSQEKESTERVSAVSGHPFVRPSLPPESPENLKGFFVSGTIYLLWALPIDTSSSGGYRVCRMEKDGSKTCRIVFQPSFSDPDVEQGILYRYRVTVLDNAMEPLESLPAWIDVHAGGMD